MRRARDWVRASRSKNAADANTREMNMTCAALAEKADTRQPAYARFSRRLRAVFIDWIIFVVVVVGVLFIAVAIESDKFSRGLGVVVAVVLLLYEPLLVWRTGSSVGHYLTNLRV